MEYGDFDDEWEYDTTREEYYWEALNAEHVRVYPPQALLRSMDEWKKFQEPMTSDDILDTMLFIRSLK